MEGVWEKQKAASQPPPPSRLPPWPQKLRGPGEQGALWREETGEAAGARSHRGYRPC